ncbi:MAG: MFS transporter [Candidatus Tyrphobacter sp.]
MTPQNGRAREIASWALLNALWIPLAFQDAALLAIAVPAVLLHLTPHDYRTVLAALTSGSSFAAMLVPPFAGWLSDRFRRGGSSRRIFAGAGLVVDILALVGLAMSRDLGWFSFFLIIAICGSNVALAAYQALLPEIVPRAQWGVVSGIRGAAVLIGAVLGLSIAGELPDPHMTFLATAAMLALFSFTLIGVEEGGWQEPERVRVRDWHDFRIVFAARAAVFFGLTMLMTFVLTFFNDVLHVPNPALGTGLVGVSALAGALVSSVWLGVLSDRVPRRLIVAFSGIPMALAALAFAYAPNPSWMVGFAALFGIGFGGVISTGWALAMDSVPELRDVARDLGIWGIATHLPNVIAPLVGGFVLETFAGSRLGYRIVFGIAGLSFTLGALVVLRIGRKPLSSIWSLPLRFAVIVSNATYLHLAYRIRGWGSFPIKRGSTLLVANHQHDLESPALVSTLSLTRRAWRDPIFSATSRRMYEPGFLAIRLHAPWLRSYNAGPLFRGIGLLPIENELSSRTIGSLAWSVAERHGRRALEDVFEERVASQFPAGTTTLDLWSRENFTKGQRYVRLTALREPFRREELEATRLTFDDDIARMENAVRSGGTFFITPEGHYTTTGAMLPMHGLLDRLAPLGTIYLAGVSYDVFVGRRLSMLYRIVQLENRDRLAATLAAIRPVTVSQLLARAIAERGGTMDDAQAMIAIERALEEIPHDLFVDPELRMNPRAMTAKALVGIQNLIDGRRHPQFPAVEDMIAYQATFFGETLRAAEDLRYVASDSFVAASIESQPPR